MKKYKLRAWDSNGALVEETIAVENKAYALLSLQDRNLRLIEIKEVKKSYLNISTGYKKDLGLFFNQLSYVISNGMNLHKGIKIIRNQIKNKGFKKIVDEIIYDVESGYSLSKAFEKHPKIFDESIIFQVRSAEEGGFIEETLKRIAVNLDKKDALKSKVKGALIYPAIVILAVIGVMYFLLTVIIPSLAETLANFDAELPFITEILIIISDFFVNYYLYMGVGLVLSVGLFIYLLSIPKFKRWLDFTLLKVPILGTMIVYANLIEFSITLSSLLNGGVQLNKALDNLINSVSNMVFHEGLVKARNSIVNEGSTFSNALNKVDFFPSSYMQILSVGEESGNIPEMLESLSTRYEEELNNVLKNSIEIINPVLMVVVAAIVGVVVMAMFMPVFSLMDQF
jgi:type IV pilus assembly protein PilC